MCVSSAMGDVRITRITLVVSFAHQGHIAFRALQAPAGNTGTLLDGVAALRAHALCRWVGASLPAPT